MRYQQQTPQQPYMPPQGMPPQGMPQQMVPPQGMPQQYVPQQPYMPPQGMQPMPVQEPYAPVPEQVPQQAPAAMPQGDCPVPLDRGYRRIAGLYFRDVWQMLLGVTGALVVVFIMVRLATRGYLWGLVFVLLAAVACELPALRLLPALLVDKLSNRMLVRTTALKGVAVQSPSLLERTGLSNRARYALMDEQGRSYFFTADKGLQQSFSDLEGAEVEIAFLEKSGLLTGINPVRRTEYLSVMESARERHLRQVFKDYLP